MKAVTVREFRDRATYWLKSKEPFVVLRRGQLAGIFFPSPTESLPVELKKEIFPVLSEQVRLSLAKRGVTEDEVLASFEAYRSAAASGQTSSYDSKDSGDELSAGVEGPACASMSRPLRSRLNQYPHGPSQILEPALRNTPPRLSIERLKVCFFDYPSSN